jgi:hypothetical protein
MKERAMIGMIIVFMIALAAAGLGYQIGFGRGVRYATQCAEEQAIATAIAHIVTDKFGAGGLKVSTPDVNDDHHCTKKADPLIAE